MSQQGSTTGLYMLILLLISLVVGALFYFGGVFGGKSEVEVNLDKPGVSLKITR